MLENMGCLEGQDRYGYASEYSSFSIKSNGIILVKKVFGDLSNKVRDRKVYEQTVDSTEGNSEAKKWLKGLWDSLKDKAQDEIADEVLSGVKTYNPQLIGFLIGLLPQQS